MTFRLMVIGFVGVAAWASAELQQVEVGGSLQIYGHYYSDFYETGDGIRLDGLSVLGRPLGVVSRDGAGGPLLSDIRAYGGDTSGVAWVEQRTALHVRAQFTDRVSTFIEFDSISEWGTDFRSNYVTGLDGPGAADVGLYQAYLELEAIGGLPLRLRLGRQELILGNEWLVGNNYWHNPLSYLSFDGVRLTYTPGDVSLDAFWTKLNEGFRGFADGDGEFYGLFGSYTGWENLTLDAYWLFLRDGADQGDTQGDLLQEWLEDAFDVDDYETTAIHTLGLRAAGEWGQLDYEGEIAYQFGEAAIVGATFAPFTYGDNHARSDVWAGQFSVGYTFDRAWSPRFYVGAEYYGGEDNRERRLGAFLNPFYRPEASVSFNRLFSSWEVDWFLDASSLSNVWLLKTGISATPTEKLDLGLDLMYFEALDTFRSPVLARLGRNRIPITGPFPWNGRDGDDSLAWQTALWMTYAYSDDLSFEAGWSHLFTGDGLEDGSFVDQNGLAFFGGLDDDDADYLYVGTSLTF